METKRVETKRVVCAVIVHDAGDGRGRRVFATQRGYGEFKDGWEFPGGKIEPGETPEQALVREIREELDTTVRPVRLLATVEEDYPAFHLTMGCYLCEIVSGHLTLLEHEAARWLDKTHLYDVPWLPADRQLVEDTVEALL